MKSILVGIPMLSGAPHCKAAIDSVINKPDVGLLIIDNGAEQEVKDLIHSYNSPNGWCIVNEKNVFVNKAWNQIIEYFLTSTFDYLCIMNSDLTMFGKWDEICRNRWKVKPDEILIPRLDEIPRNYLTAVSDAKVVTEGTPGVFITLNKRQAEMVYPIPDYVKLWFGDLFIYSVLRRLNYETVIPTNLFASHAWSSTISRLPGASDLIEEDKRQWELYGENDIRNRVEKYK